MKDLEQYLLEFVEPTVRDFEANPTSVRHAFIASVVTFHSVDYLAHPKNARQVREEFNRLSPAFRLVDRVAHAFKHVGSGDRRSPEKPPLSSADVIARPPAVWGTMVWDLSRWDDETGGVTLDSDREIDLLDVVKEAVEFVRGQKA
jgi:hypothetical protein